MISIVSADNVGFITLFFFLVADAAIYGRLRGRRRQPAAFCPTASQASGEICSERNESSTLMDVMVTNLLSC